MSNQRFTRLTHKQFATVLDWFRAKKEEFLRERPHSDEVARRINEELNINISGKRLGQFRDCAGYTWIPLRPNLRGKQRAIKHGGLGAVVRSVMSLYSKLGEAPPPELVELVAANEKED